MYSCLATKRREIGKMKKLSMIIALSSVFLIHNLSFAQSKNDSQKLDITSAALLMVSLELAEKANQLYTIKDNLVKIVKAKMGNLSAQEKYIIDVVSELKHVATIAYFESKLIGVVLIVREDFKIPFMNARGPELEESIKSTEASLQPVQIAYSGIRNTEALQQIDKAKEILQSLKQLYVNGIEILQTTKMEKGVERKWQRLISALWAWR